MAKEHASDAPVATPASKAAPRLPIVERRENVVFGQPKRQGAYLAVCENPQFTILVVHEWWGLNDQIKSMADQFAGLGGAALAVDLYQTDPATEVKEARKLMKRAMNDQLDLIAHLKEACSFLEQDFPNLKRASVGWCFGGTWSLQISLAVEMDATIIYYGHLITIASELQALKGPVLGLFAELDKGIQLHHVKDFEKALQKADKEHEVCIFEGADHAFANPSGKMYNARAAEQAWTKVLEFLSRTVLKD